MNGIRQYMNRYEQKETARRMPITLLLLRMNLLPGQITVSILSSAEGYRVSVTDSGAGLRDIMSRARFADPAG